MLVAMLLGLLVLGSGVRAGEGREYLVKLVNFGIRSLNMAMIITMTMSMLTCHTVGVLNNEHGLAV